MSSLSISSTNNELVKQLVKIATDNETRKVLAKTIAYGIHLLQEISLRRPHLIEAVFIRERYTSIVLDEVLARLGKTTTVYTISDKVAKKINILKQGGNDIIGLITTPNTYLNHENVDCDIAGDYSLPLPLIKSDRVVILDNIQDPNNLGAIFRVLAACGITQVIVIDGGVNVYHPKTLRASQGAQFALNINSINIMQAVKWLSEYKTHCPQGVIIATLANAPQSIYHYDFTKHAQHGAVWIFGNEGAGISQELLYVANMQLNIPMHYDVESLNVSVACAICLFEHNRQMQAMNAKTTCRHCEALHRNAVAISA